MNHLEGRLLYDSAQERAAVGTRNPGRADRTLLFRADPFSVDLVVHTASNDLRYFHGHVVRDQKGLPVVGAQVRLDAERQSVVTDEHGQFAVSTLDRSPRQCVVIGTEHEEVVCRIPDLGDGRDG